MNSRNYLREVGDFVFFIENHSFYYCFLFLENSIDEQLASTTGSASNTPKPPPRRLNPFNRPAPLPPAKPARAPSNAGDSKPPGNNNNHTLVNTSALSTGKQFGLFSLFYLGAFRKRESCFIEVLLCLVVV